MKDVKYIFKRIIIGTAIALILMLIRSNVFAATCSGGTWSIGYLPPNSTSWNNSTTLVRSLPNGVTRLAYGYSNTNIKNSSFNYVTSIGVDLYNYGPNSNKPTVQVRYAWSGGFTDITSVCAIGLVMTDLSQPDDLQLYRFTYNISCTYTGTNANANAIQVHLTLPRATTSKGTVDYSSMFANNPNTCLQLSPNTTDQIINADRENTIIIQNSIDNQTQIINNQTESINNINDSLTDTSTPSPTDTRNAFSDFDDATASNGVITSLIVLPVSLFTNVLNALNSSCVRFDLGTLLGTHIYFNCINPASYIGSTLWNILDVLMCGFFVWFIARKLIKVFENLSSLKEGDPVGD